MLACTHSWSWNEPIVLDCFYLMNDWKHTMHAMFDRKRWVKTTKINKSLAVFFLVPCCNTCEKQIMKRLTTRVQTYLCVVSQLFDTDNTNAVAFVLGHDAAKWTWLQRQLNQVPEATTSKHKQSVWARTVWTSDENTMIVGTN